jgi:hypothetical protein
MKAYSSIIYICAIFISHQGDSLKRNMFMIALLCWAAFSLSVMAANPSANSLGLNSLKQSESVASASAMPSPGELVILKQDSGTNLSIMNITFMNSPTYGSAQAVKFSVPRKGWKLENVLVMATDGWNLSSKKLPTFLPFAVEIRDASLKLLYHFADVQFPYFTYGAGIRMANIDVPSLPVEGDFYVCFYGYRALGLATELQNATGNSYLFDKIDGKLYPGTLNLKNNQTLPVNWLIRAAGQ